MFSISMYMQNLVKFHQLLVFLKILSGNEILTSIKGHNSVKNLRKLMCNNPNLDIVNINASAKFGQIRSICSQDIERKPILTSIKGHNSVKNLRKLTRNNPNLDLVNINAYAKFCQIPSIHSQVIERKRNSDILQGP